MNTKWNTTVGTWIANCQKARGQDSCYTYNHPHICRGWVQVFNVSERDIQSGAPVNYQTSIPWNSQLQIPQKLTLLHSKPTKLLHATLQIHGQTNVHHHTLVVVDTIDTFLLDHKSRKSIHMATPSWITFCSPNFMFIQIWKALQQIYKPRKRSGTGRDSSSTPRLALERSSKFDEINKSMTHDPWNSESKVSPWVSVRSLVARFSCRDAWER